MAVPVGNTYQTQINAVLDTRPPIVTSMKGLDFPGHAGLANGFETVRFRFFNPLAIYPATYIWRAHPRQQNSYYSAFFWGNDDGQDDLNTFFATIACYYGAHPYPDGGDGGATHKWEISVDGVDPVNGVVVYDQWYTQAFRAWGDGTGKHHEYYWDLPATDAAHLVTYNAATSYGTTNPPVPALTWGDAPWAPGGETWNGMLRGFQFYDALLSNAQIAAEIASPGSVRTPWYLNLDPTPTDILDKSGSGHHPAWVGPLRPTLWSN
jgi:hypothetical protein